MKGKSQSESRRRFTIKRRLSRTYRVPARRHGRLANLMARPRATQPEKSPNKRSAIVRATPISTRIRFINHRRRGRQLHSISIIEFLLVRSRIRGSEKWPFSLSLSFPWDVAEDRCDRGSGTSFRGFNLRFPLWARAFSVHE